MHSELYLVQIAYRLLFSFAQVGPGLSLDYSYHTFENVEP
jgi:hypothetical protein